MANCDDSSHFHVIDATLISTWTENITRAHPLHLLSGCRIVAAEHRKKIQGSEHEYIVLRTVSRGIHHHVRIERRPSRPSSLRLQFGAGVPAKDTIIISPINFDDTGSYALYTMHFPEATGPNLLDLAATLSAIISLAPRYHLYTSSCYWFARMVFEGLEHLFRGKVMEGDWPHYRGKYARFITVIDTNGDFLLRKPRALRRWERFQSAVVHGRVEKKASQLHGLIDHLYRSHREATYAAAELDVPS